MIMFIPFWILELCFSCLLIMDWFGVSMWMMSAAIADPGPVVFLSCSHWLAPQYNTEHKMSGVIPVLIWSRWEVSSYSHQVSSTLTGDVKSRGRVSTLWICWDNNVLFSILGFWIDWTFKCSTLLSRINPWWSSGSFMLLGWLSLDCGGFWLTDSGNICLYLGNHSQTCSKEIIGGVHHLLFVGTA